MKINKKYLAWLIILIILVNISFISALIIDQYVTSESVSYSRHNNDHSQTQDYGATAKMDFKKDSVTGWNGSGTYIISDGSYSTSYGDDSTWENTNITCNLGNCIKRTYMWSYSDNNYPKESESFKEEQIDTSRNWEPSYSIESSASVAVTRICDCAGATDNFEYLTNCRGYDQYGGKINPDYERYGSASCTENDMYSEKDHCSYNFDITHKEGFCCNYDQYTDGNMNSEDFVCDFNASKYSAGYCDAFGCVGDNFPNYIERPQDACNNIDTNGNGYNDACCPVSPTAAAKYVLPVTNKEKIIISGEGGGDCSDLYNNIYIRSLMRTRPDIYTEECKKIGCKPMIDKTTTPHEQACGGDGTYLCLGANTENVCNALPECKWDSKNNVCGQEIEICNITSPKQVCSPCTIATQEQDCGTGNKCCIQTGGIGTCYNPASQVCCGPSRITEKYGYAGCGEKLPRTTGGIPIGTLTDSFCVESGGICYRAGANAQCRKSDSELPGPGWIKDVSDNYNYIAGNLPQQIYDQGYELFKNAKIKGTLNIKGVSIPKTGLKKMQFWNFGDGGSVFGALEGTVAGTDVIFNFGSLQYQTKFKYEKITGYKKVVDDQGRGRGGGRGGGTPSDEPIWGTFSGKITERINIIAVGIPIFLNGGEDRWSGWWFAPTVGWDFEKIYGGMQVGHGNLRIRFLDNTEGTYFFTIFSEWYF